VQLEEEKFAGAQGTKGTATGLPKIDLVEILLAPQKTEPVIVGHCYPESHE
jgi:hypothetical protein